MAVLKEMNDLGEQKEKTFHTTSQRIRCIDNDNRDRPSKGLSPFILVDLCTFLGPHLRGSI